MNHYVVYHSVHGMGRDYEPEGIFCFQTRKSQTFIESALSGTVWVVKGTRDKSKKIRYYLMGNFQLEDFEYDTDAFLIGGESLVIDPEDQPEISSLDWFLELKREQNNFSFGFSRIRSPRVISELETMVDDFEIEDDRS